MTTPRKGMDHPDAKAMVAQREARAAATEAAMKRMDESRPTPTQEENDLARMGIMVDKADDGSGPTIITTAVVANEPLPPGGYPAKAPEDRPQATPTGKTKKEW